MSAKPELRILVTGCVGCPFVRWDEEQYEHNPYCGLFHRVKPPVGTGVMMSLSLSGYVGSDTGEDKYPEQCPLLSHEVHIKLTPEQGDPK